MHLPVASYGHDVAGGGSPARLTHTSGCDHVPPQLEGCGWSAPPRRCLPRVDQRKSRSLPEMREEPPRVGMGVVGQTGDHGKGRNRGPTALATALFTPDATSAPPGCIPAPTR